MTGAIENAFSIGEDTSHFFILETEEKFCQIRPWLARLVQWLHLERFVGTIYKANKRGLVSLEVKAQGLYEDCLQKDNPLIKKNYHRIVSLSHSLHNIYAHKKNNLLHAVQRSVNNLALALFFGHVRRLAEKKDEADWFAHLGSLQADLLVEEYFSRGGGGERDFLEQQCEAHCKTLQDLQENFPKYDKEIMDAFFSRIKAVLPYRGLNEIEDTIRENWTTRRTFKDLDEAIRTFFYRNPDASPEDIAQWVKSMLDDIAQKDPKHSLDLSSSLFVHLRDFYIPGKVWKLREIFRHLGRCLGRECSHPVKKGFEKSCARIKKWFPTEEDFSLVMEGLIREKGKEYCKAIAQTIKPTNCEAYLRAYIDRAIGLFSGGAKHIIFGVLIEILRRHKKGSLNQLCGMLGNVCIKIYNNKKDLHEKAYFVVTPVLGNSITFLGDSESEEKSVVPKDGQGDLLANLIDGDDKEDRKHLAPCFFTIERTIVAALLGEPGFCQFYGTFLGKSIIAWARERADKDYTSTFDVPYMLCENFITRNFVHCQQPILESLQEVLRADPIAQVDAAISSQEFWEKGALIQKIIHKSPESFVDGCQGMRTVAKKFIHHVLIECGKVKTQFPARPPLPFLYNIATSLSQSMLAITNALGFQGNGGQVFLELFKEDPLAEGIVQWLKAAQEWMLTQYEGHFTVPTKVGVGAPRSWMDCCANEEEKTLVARWVPYILDSKAVETSLVRAGLSTISIHNSVLQAPNPVPARIVLSCQVADALLHQVPKRHRTKNHNEAIGVLLTFAANEYDPAVTILSSIQDLFSRLEIPFPSIRVVASQKATPTKNPVLYRFDYAKDMFFVERDVFYAHYDGETIQRQWQMTSRQEVSVKNKQAIAMTVKSRICTEAS